MAPSNAEVSEQLALLRANFRQKLQGYHDALVKISEESSPDQERETLNNQLQDLINLCHKLAGSAGTFGFSALGAAMREHEHDLLAIQSNGKKWTYDMLQARSQSLQDILLKDIQD